MSMPRAYRTFRIVYAVIALNFILPAISYVVSPADRDRTSLRIG